MDLKKKTHLYAIRDKRLMSELKTHTDWKWEDRKWLFHTKGNDKKAGVAKLLSDKVDFKTKCITKDKKVYNKRQYIII